MEDKKSTKKYVIEFIGSFVITLMTLWSFKASYLKEISFLTLALINGITSMFCIWFGY